MSKTSKRDYLTECVWKELCQIFLLSNFFLFKYLVGKFSNVACKFSINNLESNYSNYAKTKIRVLEPLILYGRDSGATNFAKFVGTSFFIEHRWVITARFK